MPNPTTTYGDPDLIYLMNPGRVLRLTDVTDHLVVFGTDDKIDLTFDANNPGTGPRVKDKDKMVYVCLYLGVEPFSPQSEAEQLNIAAVMETFGWIPKPEPKPKATRLPAGRRRKV